MRLLSIVMLVAAVAAVSAFLARSPESDGAIGLPVDSNLPVEATKAPRSTLAQLEDEPPAPKAPEPEGRKAVEGLSSEYQRLLESFPELDKVPRPSSIELPSGTELTQLELGNSGEVLYGWSGEHDEEGRRIGWWLKVRRDGTVVGAHHYMPGVEAHTALKYHEGGQLQAYYPKYSESTGVEGAGWWWHPNGTPRGAGTFSGNQRTGPWLALTPAGEVDAAETKVY